MLWDLRPEGVTGSKMEKVCDACHITLNKNAVVGDVSAMNPGGVRIGEARGGGGGGRGVGMREQSGAVPGGGEPRSADAAAGASGLAVGLDWCACMCCPPALGLCGARHGRRRAIRECCCFWPSAAYLPRPA